MNLQSTPGASSQAGEELFSFSMIRILNLPHRSDRRRAVRRELARLDLAIDGGRIAFLEAIRPTTLEGFDGLGARGCFLSHLAALKAARDANAFSLLILEDDVSFSAAERKSMKTSLHSLAREPWDIFYGGSPVAQLTKPLTHLSADTPAQLTHFIAFSRQAILLLVPYMEAMLSRPPGSPDGGPMHVDGAYTHFRYDNPRIVALAATPPIAHQRASRTDIHVLGTYDRLTALRPIMAAFRSIKNLAASRR